MYTTCIPYKCIQEWMHKKQDMFQWIGDSIIVLYQLHVLEQNIVSLFSAESGASCIHLTYNDNLISINFSLERRIILCSSRSDQFVVVRTQQQVLTCLLSVVVSLFHSCLLPSKQTWKTCFHSAATMFAFCTHLYEWLSDLLLTRMMYRYWWGRRFTKGRWVSECWALESHLHTYAHTHLTHVYIVLYRVCNEHTKLVDLIIFFYLRCFLALRNRRRFIVEDFGLSVR